MNKKILFALVFLLNVFLFGFSKAEACTCKSSNSPCATFERADAVFTATAEEIDDPQNTPRNEIKLKIDEAFKGIDSAGEVVRRTGVCDYNFQSGKNYLVYAQRDEKTKKLTVFLCSRTTSIEKAATDLKFIRMIAAGKSFASVYGKVEQPTEKESPRSQPLPNVKIVLFTDRIKKGDKYISPKAKERQREILTNATGYYRFDDLQIGFHRLKIFPPDGQTAWREEIEITSGSQSCAEYDFSIFVDGRISGKIVSANGAPVPRAYVNLSAVEYNAYRYVPGTQTDANGNYEIRGIAPGKYKLSVSVGAPNSGSGFPFGRYYFPATYNNAEAQIIELGYAEKVRNVNLKTPPVSFVRKIQIEVAWENGTPISPPNVHYKVFAGTAETSPQYVYSDKDGQPTLTIYSGFDYQIYAFGSLEDGRLYETDPLIVTAENAKDVIKLKARIKN